MAKASELQIVVRELEYNMCMTNWGKIFTSHNSL